MKKRHLFLLLPLALAMQGCPYIASGDSLASDKITLEDLQGCQYFEDLYISSFSQYSTLRCEKKCIIDSVYYSEHRFYKADTNFLGTDTSLASPLWELSSAWQDTAIVKLLEPENDGFYYYNFKIGNEANYSDDYLNASYKKEWTLCKE